MRERTSSSHRVPLSVSCFVRRQAMVRAKFISLSRIWYTIFIVAIQLILLYFGMKQYFFNDRLIWPKSSSSTPTMELLVQRICLIASFIVLLIFIYPALFQIGNLSNDHRQLTIKDFSQISGKKAKISLCRSLWHHCFSLSSTLHLLMSFLLAISTTLIDAKQILVGLKDSGKSTNNIHNEKHSFFDVALLWRTDLDLLFDWSPGLNVTSSPLSFSIDSYSRLCLLNFLFASFICILREPYVFWSVSKMFSIIYSFTLALNVFQWCLMHGAFQLLLKNVCFNTIDSSEHVGYLLLSQPYTTFFLYLLLEFLIYISSITLYYYAYNRFKYDEIFHWKSSCYDRCTHYCPSLIAIILLLLYTACKMPLVHDIFLLYLQTRLNLLIGTFIFEIVHVLLILALWIYLTTKIDWHLQRDKDSSSIVDHRHGSGLTVKNNSIQPTAVSLPELNSNACSTMEKTSRRLSDNIYQKPYEKIHIVQSEIYYRNRPKNWSLPLNQQPTMMAKFDDDDIVCTTAHPTNEVQYREAIRKTVSNLYKLNHEEQQPPLRNNLPPTPPMKRFTQEQVEAARMRTQQMIMEQAKSSDYMQHHRSATLLISQV